MYLVWYQKTLALAGIFLSETVHLALLILSFLLFTQIATNYYINES